MMHRRALVVIACAVVIAGGVSAGIAFAVAHTSTTPSVSTSTDGSSYDYYRSMMGQFGNGSMMGGGSYGWMMGQSGYSWMMGGSDSVPGWMNGGSLPGFMMGGSTDPGQVMGRLFADAPGPRVTPSQATELGNATPAGATVDKNENRITFTGQNVSFTVVASPAGTPDETFHTAGLVNPTIVVAQGAHVTMEIINADNDTAHGLVIATSGSSDSWMPMMTARPVFPDAALWFLGNPTSAGMHSGTITFTATTASTYQYLCPVPGHAQKGMVGTFIVTG